jgi:hypothetical protein
MAYTINNYDGTPLTTIADGQIDSTTSLELPGPNYVGYGQKLNENLVFLMESFAGNVAPAGTNLQGQLWFNKSAQTLNVFTNQGYSPVSGIVVSSSEPLTANPGNTWFSTVTNQYKLYDGTNWNLIGPIYSKDQGVSGAIPLTVNDADTSGVTHNIVQIQFGPLVLATLSSDASFRPSPAITGFTRINPGITLNSTITNPSFNSNIVGNLTGDVIGNLTGSQVTATSLIGALTGPVTGTVNGNVTSSSSIANNFSSSNVLISGGNVNSLTTLSATTAQATNFNSGNILVSGGNANGLTTLGASTLIATNLSSGNALITGGSATGLTTLGATTSRATNFSSGNVLVGSASATTLVATNFSSGNVIMGSASATTLVATNFSSGNVLVTGGNVISLTALQAITAQATNLSSGNALITGGNVIGLTTLVATTLLATNLSSGNVLVTGGNITGINTLQANNLSSGNVLVGSAGATTLVATNFSSGNVIMGSASATTLVATNFSSGNITGTFTGTVNGTITATATTLPYNTNNTSIATTAFVQNVLPQGVIVMWGGSVASIPAGWSLCNGSNGTPDLRDRFVVGAGTTYSPAATGGSATATLSTNNLPSHTHSMSGSASGTTGVAGSHSHTATSSVTDVGHSHAITDPSHNHTFQGTGLGSQGQKAGNETNHWETKYTDAAVTGITINAASTGISVATSLSPVSDHSHSLNVTLTGTTGSAGSGTAFGILPPYYALCYIQKMF